MPLGSSIRCLVCFAAAAFLTAALPAQVWTIRNGENLIYLGGSVHVLREEDYPLPEAFEAAYADSEILVLETDIDQLNNPKAAQEAAAMMMMPEGRTLKTLLSGKVFARLETLLLQENPGLDMKDIMRLKPAMVINLLTARQNQRLGLSREGPDFYFFRKAKEDKKAMGFLEDLDVQLRLATSLGDGYEDEYVRYSLGDWAIGEKMLRKIIDEWKAARFQTLEEELTVIGKKYPSVHRDVFTSRNEAWVIRLEEYLRGPPVEFVIVGAGHLYGPGGLLELLRLRGFQAELFTAF